MPFVKVFIIVKICLFKPIFLFFIHFRIVTIIHKSILVPLERSIHHRFSQFFVIFYQPETIGGRIFLVVEFYIIVPHLFTWKSTPFFHRSVESRMFFLLKSPFHRHFTKSLVISLQPWFIDTILLNMIIMDRGHLLPYNIKN